MKNRIAVLVCTLLLSSATWAEETATTATLYERLGGEEGVTAIVEGTIERHLDNPAVSAYFQHLDTEWLIGSVIAFFTAGTGGPNNYSGSDMVTAHKHLNISDTEFNAAVADVLDSVKASGAPQDAYDEVAAILESFRAQVVSS